MSELNVSFDVDRVLAEFREHGYARLGRLVPNELLQAMRDRANALMLGEVRHAGLFFQHDAPTGSYEDLELGRGYIGPSLAYRKLEKLELDPVFLKWVNAPVCERIVRAWIPGEVVIYRSILMNKAAMGGSMLPFHQDGGTFWGLDRNPTLQLWTALDDAPVASGCLELIPGSHKGGLTTPLGGVIPEDILESADAEARVVRVAAEAGEVILIHNHVWHRSSVNRTNNPRRAFSVCYMSAETRCTRKKKTKRSFFPVFRSG